MHLYESLRWRSPVDLSTRETRPSAFFGRRLETLVRAPSLLGARLFPSSLPGALLRGLFYSRSQHTSLASPPKAHRGKGHGFVAPSSLWMLSCTSFLIFESYLDPFSLSDPATDRGHLYLMANQLRSRERDPLGPAPSTCGPFFLGCPPVDRGTRGSQIQ